MALGIDASEGRDLTDKRDGWVMGHSYIINYHLSLEIQWLSFYIDEVAWTTFGKAKRDKMEQVLNGVDKATYTAGFFCVVRLLLKVPHYNCKAKNCTAKY